MAVTINNSCGQIKSIRMDTGRVNRRFYHLATIKFLDNRFVVVRNSYDMYGDKAEGLWTDNNGCADFLADGGTAAIWIEDGVGLTLISTPHFLIAKPHDVAGLFWSQTLFAAKKQRELPCRRRHIDRKGRQHLSLSFSFLRRASLRSKLKDATPQISDGFIRYSSI